MNSLNVNNNNVTCNASVAIGMHPELGSNEGSQAPALSLNTYENMTRNMDKTAIYEISHQIPNFRESVQRLPAVLNMQDWDDPIFDHQEEFAYIGLEAFRKNLISFEQFSTLTFYYSIREHHRKEEIQSIPLFIGSKVNPFAWNAIKSTLKPNKNHTSICDDYQLNSFFQGMKTKSNSEKQFFVFTDLQMKRESHSPATISQVIHKTAGINIFSRIFHGEASQKRMFPSFTMMQAFLNEASITPSPVVITPVIGLSTVEEIVSNGETGTRDMALSFPGSELPKKADFIHAFQGYDFTYHDFYHAFMTSMIPDHHRLAFVKIAKLIKELSAESSSPEDREIFQEYAERFIDLEMTEYRQDTAAASNYLEMEQDDRESTQFIISLEGCYESLVLRNKKDESRLKDKFFNAQIIKNTARKIIEHQNELINFGNIHFDMVSDEDAKNIKKSIAVNHKKMNISSSDYKNFKKRDYALNILIQLNKAQRNQSKLAG